MVRVQNVLCSFFVCQILYEKRRCFGISSNVHQINEEIRDSEIRLISATGEQLGIMSAAQAQHIADEQGLDLVKISPQAKPPVCKLMDYGKFRFEQGKREKEARKNQHVVEIKDSLWWKKSAVNAEEKSGWSVPDRKLLMRSSRYAQMNSLGSRLVSKLV